MVHTEVWLPEARFVHQVSRYKEAMICLSISLAYYTVTGYSVVLPFGLCASYPFIIKDWGSPDPDVASRDTGLVWGRHVIQPDVREHVSLVSVTGGEGSRESRAFPGPWGALT